MLGEAEEFIFFVYDVLLQGQTDIKSIKYVTIFVANVEWTW